MKLTILGASGARPNGGDASAGYLVQSATTAILLDCGSGVVSKLQAAMNPRDLDAVVISHIHSDHSLDLIALLLLAPGLEREVGGARLLGWFLGGTLAGAALSLLLSPGPLLGTGPALAAVAFASARGGSDPAARPGARAWLGIVLAIAALLPWATTNPDGTVRVVLIAALIGAGLAMTRSRKPARVERRVELPNSHFNPPGVHHEVRMTTPWDVIDVDSLHEVNREGVEILLRRARELGPTHLSPADRELLDRMATAARLTAERSRDR